MGIASYLNGSASPALFDARFFPLKRKDVVVQRVWHRFQGICALARHARRAQHDFEERLGRRWRRILPEEGEPFLENSLMHLA